VLGRYCGERDEAVVALADAVAPEFENVKVIFAMAVFNDDVFAVAGDDGSALPPPPPPQAARARAIDAAKADARISRLLFIAFRILA
jgi:hypothetical protein